MNSLSSNDPDTPTRQGRWFGVPLLFLGVGGALLLVLLCGCGQQEVERSLLAYQQDGGVWLKNGSPFTGVAVEYFSDGTPRSRRSVRDGRLHGRAETWFESGHHASVSTYRDGRFHGLRQVWSHDAPHHLVSESRHTEGVAQGEHRVWYPSGELYQIRQYVDGRESGLQRAFRKNGDLYANYEMRNGRAFGMRRANLCFSLTDESIAIDTP